MIRKIDNKSKNLCLTGFFRNFPVKKNIRINSSEILVGESDREWIFFKTICEIDLELFLQKETQHLFFAGLFENQNELIKKYISIDWVFSSIQFVFSESEEIPSIKISCKQIDSEFADFIYKNSMYKEYSSLKYIREQIEKGFCAGIFENKNLVAWGMIHDDDSIGFINVLPEFRRKGYARNITLSLMHYQRNNNRDIFLHVKSGNTKALNLFVSIGFTQTRPVYWMKLKE